jgi:hypothetical protein
MEAAPESRGLSGDFLDLSCCVLADEAWLYHVLKSPGVKRISLRGCVFEPDNVGLHNAFVARLGSIGLASSLEWIDLRGLRPDEGPLLAFVASLHQKKIEVLVGVVNKTLGLKLLDRASSSVALGFGDSNVAFVKGRRACFALIAELVKKGETTQISGIRSDIDDTVDPSVERSKTTTKEKPKKPWQKK